MLDMDLMVFREGYDHNGLARVVHVMLKLSPEDKTYSEARSMYGGEYPYVSEI